MSWINNRSSQLRSAQKFHITGCLMVVPNKARILLILALIYFACLGAISVDYGLGFGSDEPQMIQQVQQSFTTGLFLPRVYNYPSLSYDLYVAAAIPQTVSYIARHLLTGTQPSGKSLAQFQEARGALLRVRFLFFLLSIVSGIAVYLLVCELSGNPWIALFGALTLLASWEFMSHARRAVSDCLVLSCGAWAMYYQCLLLKNSLPARQSACLILASVFSGLCMSAKYPGGIVVLPLLAAIVFGSMQASASPFPYRRIGASLLIVIVTFVVITPGSVLEPGNFVLEVYRQKQIYGTGFYGHTIPSSQSHLLRLLEYLGLVAFSHRPWISLIIMLLAVLGAVSLFRQRYQLGIWLAIVPVVYSAYMSRQNVMYVRNYMLLLPFLAAFSALGLWALWLFLQRYLRLRLLLGSGAVGMLMLNLAAVTSSAWSIHSPDKSDGRARLERRIAESPATTFYLSKRCRDLIGANRITQQPNIVPTPDTADRYVFFTDEIEHRPGYSPFRANVRGRYFVIHTPIEDVNQDYYPIHGACFTGERTLTGIITYDEWRWVRILEISAADPELEELKEAVVSSNHRDNGRPTKDTRERSVASPEQRRKSE